MEKELCSHENCNEIATYCYMPGYSSGASPYSCDKHVNRGCSCNWNYVDESEYNESIESKNLPEGLEGKDWKWVIEPESEHCAEIKSGVIWTDLNENGLEYPCCEYMWDGNGFEREED